MVNSLRAFLSIPFFFMGLVGFILCLWICGEENQKLIDESFKKILKKLEQYG